MNRQLIIRLETPCKLSNHLVPNEINWSFNESYFNNQELSKHNFYPYFDFDFVQHKFKRINFIEYHKNKDIIYYRSSLNLIRHLTLNPKHHAKIRSLGYSLENFNLESRFHEWYEKLFKFNDYLNRMYIQAIGMTKSSSNKTKLICAQIRLGDHGDMQFTARENTKKYWNFIQKKFISSSSYSYKLFVTTDTSDVN